jgi:hypothetical protein
MWSNNNNNNNNNNTVTNNNFRRFQDFTVPFKTPHGHAKEFLRNLQTIRARTFKRVRQPWNISSINV